MSWATCDIIYDIIATIYLEYGTSIRNKWYIHLFIFHSTFLFNHLFKWKYEVLSYIMITLQYHIIHVLAKHYSPQNRNFFVFIPLTYHTIFVNGCCSGSKGPESNSIVPYWKKKDLNCGASQMYSQGSNMACILW